MKSKFNDVLFFVGILGWLAFLLIIAIARGEFGVLLNWVILSAIMTAAYFDQKRTSAKRRAVMDELRSEMEELQRAVRERTAIIQAMQGDQSALEQFQIEEHLKGGDAGAR